MILDNEEQRQFLLECINAVNFPGKTLEAACMMKQTVQFAKIAPPEPTKASEVAS